MAAAVPPAPLLARATDLAVLDKHFTARTLEWALAVNVVVAALAFAAFGVLRVASPFAAKLFSPRALLAVAEEEADAADKAAADEADSEEKARVAALASLAHAHARARRLPPLPTRGWIRFLFDIPDQHVIDYAGLDALIFMRFYALCAILFVPAAVLLPALLCPLYAAESSSPSDVSVQGVPDASAERFSVATLADGSPRFWAPVVAAYCLTLSLMWLLLNEQRTLLRLRLAASTAAPARPEELAVLVTDIPPSHAAAADVQAYFRDMYPGLGEFPLVAMAPKVDAVEAAYQARNAAAAAAHAARAALAVGEAAAASAEERGSDAQWRRAEAASTAGEALEAAERALRQARANALRGPSSSAFVLFPTRAAAAAAAGTLHSAYGGSWHAHPAPPPEGVLWHALQLSPLARYMRNVMVFLFGALLVITFMFVVAAVASLVSINTASWLPTSFAGTEPLLGGYVAAAVLIAGLYVAPQALQSLAYYGGHVSRADADVAASEGFFWLCVVDVFAGTAAVSSLLTQLGDTLAPDGDGFSLTQLGAAIGDSVPSAAPFFIAFALTRAGTALAAQLTRVADSPQLLAKLTSATTRRADFEAWAPKPPPFVDWGPTALFMLLLGLVYAPLAPLIAPPLAAAFAGGAVVFRYQLLYVYSPTRGGGGRLWIHLRDGAAQASLVAVAVLAAVLGWRRAAGPSIALAPLFVAIIVVWRLAVADDSGEAFRVLPRDVAAAADAEHGALSTPLPFPFPESYYPLCMFDDVALLPDLPLDDARAAKEAKAAAAAERAARLAALEAGAAAEAAAAEAAEHKPLKAPSGSSGYGSMWAPSATPSASAASQRPPPRAPPPPSSRGTGSGSTPPESETSQSDVEAPRDVRQRRPFER